MQPGKILLRLLAFSTVAVLAAPLKAAEPTRPPNVLFIVIDDQNDWIGALGGHPLAKTPRLDALAATGVLFANAHCQSPLCNPSRTSVLLGLRPTTTGVYGLAPSFRSVDRWRDRVTLPQYFGANGYETLVAGKVFHHEVRASAAETAEFDVYGPAAAVGAKPPQKLAGPTPMGNNVLMDWGTFPHRDEDKGDYQLATWAAEQLRARRGGKPFFLAVGFSLPHVPCYATEAWFQQFPDDDSVLPAVLEEDRADTPRFSWYLHWLLPEPRLSWVKEHQQWRNLVRSYLACTAFVDAQIGRVLDALAESALAENTVVVVWSDHGWHLGEKGITGKNSLWERSTHVPLIFAGPGVAAGERCEQPVELLDIYPTLVDLCGLPARGDLEGHSLAPQLRDATAVREWPAITSHNQGNHSIRTDRWRYIRYADGSEELYDLQSDPHEWTNLASAAASLEIIAALRQWLPQIDSPPAPGSASRILTYDESTDTATWEGSSVRRDDPIPQ